MRIRYINAKHAGANHDSFIWNCSEALTFFENAYRSGDRNSRLLGARRLFMLYDYIIKSVSVSR